MSATPAAEAEDHRAARAARSNARWCDAVCRAHGVPGVFTEDLWLARGPVPRFYPNLVTLSDRPGAAERQREAVADLGSLGLAGDRAVKDSFRALDLDGLGYGVLFDATWLWLEAAPSGPEAPAPEPAPLACARVGSPVELALWEATWRGDGTSAPAVADPPVFPAELLANPGIAFIAARRGRELAAGAVAHRTGDVVGLSNVFVALGEAEAAWSACVAFARRCFPGLPLTGYESGADLEVALRLGFAPAGPLRVWVRAA